MLLVASKDVLSEHDVKYAAGNIKKLSGRVIKHSHALEIVSALLGYKNYFELHKSLKKFGEVVNMRRNRELINMKIFDIRKT